MKFAWNFHNECCSIRKLFSNFVLSQTDRHTESVFHSVLTKKSDSFNVNRGNEQHSFSCLDRFGQNNFAPQFSYLFKCGVKHSFIRFWVLSEPLCRWTKTAPHFLFVQPTTCNTRLVELRGGGNLPNISRILISNETAYRRIARWNNLVYAVVRVPKPGTYPKEYGPGASVWGWSVYMHADEPDRRYGHEIQNLSFVMRIALGMERPGAERSFENKRTVRCFYEYKPRSRNRSGPEMDIGHHGRFQRMDAVARPPLETLARAPRSAVMVLRPFCRTFYRFPDRKSVV